MKDIYEAKGLAGHPEGREEQGGNLPSEDTSTLHPGEGVSIKSVQTYPLRQAPESMPFWVLSIPSLSAATRPHCSEVCLGTK